jgi:tRNA(Arg) A34 adenosine deaminase TadA
MSVEAPGIPESVSSDEEAMGLAIDAARRGIEAGQSPFGCCIVQDGRVLAVAHNRVWLDTDATAHAEVIALRAACRSRGGIDLSGSTLYATCEPCPMCYAAAHWARIDRVVFGADIDDARAAGFNELAIPADVMRKQGQDSIVLRPGLRVEECRDLFRYWRELGRGRPY